MAYNRSNLLRRIIRIQEITSEHTQHGVTQEYVYRVYISKSFRISRSTYYNYLAINAKRELSKAESSNLQI